MEGSMKSTEEVLSMIGEDSLGRFLAARGAPFYGLQKQLCLLREDAFRAGHRSILFVGLAWGVPLILSLIAGDAFGPHADGPYIFELGVWSRYFIAIGIFILMERQVEERLRTHLVQFARAPLLAPGSFEPATEAVTKSLRRRDSKLAEFVCLMFAILSTIAMYIRLSDIETSSWLMNVSSAGKTVTLAGWWCFLVSNPLFSFLLFRWLWRLCIWSLLLRDLAKLELRLVATHPDGNGGLAFIGLYPNAYTSYVFALSCVMGSTIAQEFLTGELAASTYGYVMGGWLIIVLAVFTFPLLSFNSPLTKLKHQTYFACSSLATRHYRAAERDLLGRNINALEDADTHAGKEIPDPSKAFTAAQKLSGLIVSRSALFPISAAALLPLVAAGAIQLPFKELFKVMKRLLLL